MQKKATDSLLYTQAELWLKKELKSRRGFKGRYRLHHRFYKMWIMISSSSAESKLDFGGEGLFYATLHAVRLFIQSLPFSRLADRIIASAPRAGGDSRGEGSLLGGLGNLLDGDNRFYKTII
jgi:hypothetical protein